MNSKFNIRFVAYSLLIGGIFVFAGFMIMPVHVTLNFSLDMLPVITNNLEFWVRSFQILVFGYFIRIIGLVGLTTLHQESDCKPLINSGVMVCSLAMLVSGLAEGYYMHSGGWAQWKMTLIPADQHQNMINSLEITNEWVSCIKRFGRMFMHLGLTFLGWGIIRSQYLAKWFGTITLVLGISGICLLMILTENPDSYLPMDHVVTIWFLLAGFLVYKKSQ